MNAACGSGIARPSRGRASKTPSAPMSWHPLTTAPPVPAALLTQLVRDWKNKRSYLEAIQVRRDSGFNHRRDANARAAQLTECIEAVELVLRTVDRSARTPAVSGGAHG
jgi:hypothetical protein